MEREAARAYDNAYCKLRDMHLTSIRRAASVHPVFAYLLFTKNIIMY